MRVVVYPNERAPAHIHVVGRRHEAVFQIDCPASSVALKENYGFPFRDVVRIAGVLRENLGTLCRAWEGIHGS